MLFEPDTLAHSGGKSGEFAKFVHRLEPALISKGRLPDSHAESAQSWRAQNVF